MRTLQYAISLQDESEIPRFAKNLELDEVWLKSTWLNMPRASGAARLASRCGPRLPAKTALGAYAWHYLTHRADDPLPGRGTRTIPTGGEHGPCGHLQSSAACDLALEASARVLEAIGSRTLVLATPSSLAPGALGQRRLRGFFERAKARDLAIIWEPTGLWEPEAVVACALGADVQVVLDAFDPASAAACEQVVPVWLRVGGAGERVHLSGAQAEQLAFDLEARSAHPPRGLVFAGPKAFGNARSFQSAFAGIA